MGLNLNFKEGSQENYNALAEKESGVFYLTDEKKLYLGDILLNSKEVYCGEEEPVDQDISLWLDPSETAKSSNHWELIQNITVQNTCQYVIYNVDLNGKPFNLRKAIVYIYRPATSSPELSASFDNTVQTSPWNKGDWVRWYLNGSTGVHSATIEKLSNGQINISSIQTSYNNAMYYNLVGTSNDKHFWTYTPTKTYSDLRALAVGGENSNSLPAGSHILLYGIREVE